MGVACCLLLGVVIRCPLFVVCCALGVVVWSSLFVCCHLLFDAFCLLVALGCCYSVFVFLAYCLLIVICCLSFVVCCLRILVLFVVVGGRLSFAFVGCSCLFVGCWLLVVVRC